MRIPSKIEYAYLGVLELTRACKTQKPVQIGSMAETHNLSSKFLLQVMIQLKNAGIIKSIRGASGGYILAKRPDKISLKEVVEAVDHAVMDNPFEPGKKVGQSEKPLVAVWNEMNESILKTLDEVDFDALNRKSMAEKAIVYNI